MKKNRTNKQGKLRKMAIKQTGKQVLTVAEAAKILSVCPTTIRRYLRQKILKSFKLCTSKNGAYRIPIKEIEKLLKGK